MTPEEILARPPKVLTQEQRARYFEDGYLIVENAVSDEWIGRLRAALADFDERSRAMDGSEKDFTVEKRHAADNRACARSCARRTITRRSGIMPHALISPISSPIWSART